MIAHNRNILSLACVEERGELGGPSSSRPWFGHGGEEDRERWDTHESREVFQVGWEHGNGARASPDICNSVAPSTPNFAFCTYLMYILKRGGILDSIVCIHTRTRHTHTHTHTHTDAYTDTQHTHTDTHTHTHLIVAILG